jgi:hypothetical protein
MRIAAALLLFTLASCATTQSPRASATSPVAQAIVDRMACEHAEIARLSIHAVPLGQSSARIVASTVAGRLGEPSDPEDVRSLSTGEVVVLREGRNLDDTAPVHDSAGRTLAAIGITISGTAGTGEAQLARAKQLAEQVAAAIRELDQPLL